ncbi:hypothetical protein BKA67DRAFT_541560 [Truncatella angustata]|uniref:Uncharacterized protein n=1 Tax=Truncatella angustata TaxID=152316 RepID=A0A9P8U8L6_9PEZI|nr:uncharacterized protein BKA67DRAFT_541560 [Truncatella angustata]KAH6645334.1 hypothetical protein BKA67DRAFT_541560 [Truncatella angustata]
MIMTYAGAAGLRWPVYQSINLLLKSSSYFDTVNSHDKKRMREVDDNSPPTFNVSPSPYSLSIWRETRLTNTYFDWAYPSLSSHKSVNGEVASTANKMRLTKRKVELVAEDHKDFDGATFEVQWVDYPATPGNKLCELEANLKRIPNDMLEEYWQSKGGRAKFLARRSCVEITKNLANGSGG